jgi:hypothetical protein
MVLALALAVALRRRETQLCIVAFVGFLIIDSASNKSFLLHFFVHIYRYLR